MTNLNPKKANFLKQIFTNVKHDGNDNKQQVMEDGSLLNYYSSLAMYHPDLIVVISTDGKVLSQNRGSINKLLGYSDKTKIDYKEQVSEELYAMLKVAFNNALKGKSERHDISVNNKSGQPMHIDLTFIPIKGNKNEVGGVYLIIKDVTEYYQLNKRLQINEKHLIHAQQIAKVGSWEYVIEENKLVCSDYFYDIFGFDKVDHISMERPFDFVHPDDYQVAIEKVNKAVHKGISYVSEFRIHHGKTNEIRYIGAQAEVTWAENKPHKLVGVIRDLTEQKLLEEKLENQMKNIKHIQDNINAGFWLRESMDGEMSYISKGIENIAKTPLSTFYEEPDFWDRMILPAHHNEILEARKGLSLGGSIHIRYRIMDGEGTTKWISEQTIPTINSKGVIKNIFGMITDISHEVEMQEKLKMFATHDPLTILPNQRSLYEKLDVLCKGDQPFAILSLDLDRLNVINDSLGHQIGDEVLKKIANRIISIVPNDGYVARLNSSNFIIVVQAPRNKDDIFKLAENILVNIEKKLTIQDYELHVLSSIGISFFPGHGDNKITLLESAQSALYHAKRQGESRYQLYSFSKNISSHKKYVLEQDMRRAIMDENFELYYQPQVNPKTKTIEGVEALIRWNHEEWGTVSPSEFIPLAEENHLIHQISDWVIKQVCAQLRKWKDDGHTLRPVAINISPIRFLKKGLAELVKEQLELQHIPAKYLELEITEGSLLKSDSHILNTLAALKELGVRIAIDDFGTGHATLHYLREFQVDTIKIDQVFIQSNNEKVEVDKAIVSSVLHLAKGLNIKVVAEGVETYNQYEYLKQKECDLVQGYLFSQPVPLERMEEMLKDGYLEPTKQNVKPKEERRKYYRFEFPYCVLGEMEILELNKKKVDLGSAKILIENISLGGIKFLSSLKLPINANLKLRFFFKVLNEQFAVEGSLEWINDARGASFYYGIKFDLGVQDEDRLSRVINRLSALRKLNQEIPDTNFIYQNPYLYLNENQL